MLQNLTGRNFTPFFKPQFFLYWIAPLQPEFVVEDEGVWRGGVLHEEPPEGVVAGYEQRVAGLARTGHLDGWMKRGTGWPIRLLPRFCWQQYGGCVSVYALHTKTQFLLWCQQYLGNNPDWLPCRKSQACAKICRHQKQSSSFKFRFLCYYFKPCVRYVFPRWLWTSLGEMWWTFYLKTSI